MMIPLLLLLSIAVVDVEVDDCDNNIKYDNNNIYFYSSFIFVVLLSISCSTSSVYCTVVSPKARRTIRVSYNIFFIEEEGKGLGGSLAVWLK